MARQVISKSDQLKMRAHDDSTALREAQTDTFKDRLLKYIPGEIVAAFIFVQGLIVSATANTDENSMLYWMVFIAFAILTPLYLWKLMDVKKVVQLIISFFAFIVWVFAIGGPFISLEWYQPLYGAVLLPIFTLLVAIVVAEK